MVRAHMTTRISTGGYYPPRHQYEPMESRVESSSEYEETPPPLIQAFEPELSQLESEAKEDPRRSFESLTMKRKKVLFQVVVNPYHRHEMKLLRMMIPLLWDGLERFTISRRATLRRTTDSWGCWIPTSLTGMQLWSILAASTHTP